MQFEIMDCSSGRANHAERDSDLGDDLSHDDRSDDEMRDCDSLDGEHLNRRRRLLNTTTASNGTDMSFGGNGSGGMGNAHSPEQQHEMHLSRHPQFLPNHPLNALGNFMGIGGLHGIPNFQPNEMLEKLKMQVRDMKVMQEQDYAAAHAAAAFGAANLLPTPINTAFTLPPTSLSAYGHVATAQNMITANSGGVGGGITSSGVSSSLTNGNVQNATNSGTQAGAAAAAAGVTATLPNGGSCTGGGAGSGNSSFSFTSPTAPSSKDVNPASNSSTSSEASNSSQQNNGWSFEEQYKQVRQLYEINDDPKRKEFLDDLFSFMQKRGTPINRLPIMAKSVLDLYELYNLVIARGGLVDVINKKLWQEIIKGLHLPSSITSAAFTLRTQYMKYLYPYECEKKNLSSPSELQAAIDGNRREGRRSSYGQYEAMHNQMQLPSIARQSLSGSMQQMSPLALVTHAANNQQAQAAAAAAAAHHRLMAPSFGQMPNPVTLEIEQRMMEYLKLIQAKKEQNAVNAAAAASVAVGGGSAMPSPLHHQQQVAQQQQQQQQQQRQRSPSPEITPRDALNALEMSRVALWQMYHNNTSPPASVNTSPQGIGGCAVGVASASGNAEEPQRSEALNLSDLPPNLNNIKRERETSPEPRDDFHQPPIKRTGGVAVGAVGLMPPGFPANFYLPHGMAAAAAAANFHHATHDSDAEHDDENENDEDEGEHNTTVNSSSHDEQEAQQLNGHLHHQLHYQHNHRSSNHHHHQHNHSSNGGHNDKSDDSAIENSPTTSASAGNGHISPVSTKKIHLSKQQAQESSQHCGTATGAAATTATTIGPLQTLNLLSGMQFHVAHNGTSANGEQQLIVNLELNGIKYAGVLVASATATLMDTDVALDNAKANDVSKTTAATTATTAEPTHVPTTANSSISSGNSGNNITNSNSKSNSNSTEDDLLMDAEATSVEQHAIAAATDTTTALKVNSQSTIGITNGAANASSTPPTATTTPTAATMLKETLITTTT